MKTAKTLLLVLTLFALLGVIVALSFAKPAIPQELQGAAPGSIDEMVMQALVNGENLASIGIVAEHESVDTFDQAKASLSVLIAPWPRRDVLSFIFQS